MVSDSLFVDAMTLQDNIDYLDEEAVKREISALDDEIRRLSTELKELSEKRKNLNESICKSKIDDVILPLVLSKSDVKFDSAADKADFLLSLFSPRTDVYAVRRVKDGKASYFPKCTHFWDSGCLKRNGEKGRDVCRECPNREYETLCSDVIIKGTFRNKDPDGGGAIGIYPLKDGNVTRFIAIDLDEKTWERDARCILSTARRLGFPMLWEKSFSGCGAHLWILFSEDMPALDARNLALSIIDKAREEYPGLSLTSYDRLFPSQNELHDKGIGNLILLPLVGSASSRGCTLFLDDDGIPYPLKQQLEYLSSVPKVSRKEVEEFLVLSSSCYFDASIFSLCAEDFNPGWKRRIPKISVKDVKDKLILYLSSGISFDKRVLSVRMQEALRRFATIFNPEYFKNLRKNDGMAWNLSSRLALYEENERVIKLPRGLYKSVVQLLELSGIQFLLEDHRVAKTSLDASFGGKLRAEQEEALGKLLSNENGILATATGFGKTIVAMALIAKRKERVLIIVPSSALMDEWESKVKSFLEIRTTASGKRSKSGVGIRGKGKNRLSGVVDIMTIQSLSSAVKNGNFDFALNYGMVIIDECHHIAAENYRAAISVLNAKYVYGLSATPRRGDGLEKIVYSECGPILYSYDTARLSYDRGLALNYVTRFFPTALEEHEKKAQFSSLIERIANDENRNEAIVSDIVEAYKSGRRIIVFTRRIAQNDAIAKELEKFDIPYASLDGKVGKKVVRETLEDIKNGQQRKVLISTDLLLGEGVDIPDLDTLFLASPYMQERVIQQCSGRLLRTSEGKTSVLIYDYVDYKIPRLSYMFTKRVTIYKKLGFIPLGDNKIPYERILYFSYDFLAPLIADIKGAEKEIMLSSSFLLPSAVTRRIFEELKLKSDAVSIMLFMKQNKKEAKLDELSLKYLNDISISVAILDRARNFIVIDRKICWYGELNILGLGKKDIEKGSSIMRILDKQAATSLIENNTNLL